MSPLPRHETPNAIKRARMGFGAFPQTSGFERANRLPADSPRRSVDFSGEHKMAKGTWGPSASGYQVAIR
jgi:hypothetical protein